MPPSMSDSLDVPIPIVAKFPRSLADGVVGLGIVAALKSSHNQTHKQNVGSIKFPARSSPITINQGAKLREKPVLAAAVENEGKMELSESYTCMTFRSGDDSIASKRVYFGRGGDGVDVGVAFELSSPPPKATLPVGDFSSWCFLCGKSLHGLDAFIYRGEKAFCSVECRYHHITREEAKRRNTAEVTKPFSCSSSPCSSPFPFATGLAAA